MARIFTIRFTYEGNLHHAIIGVRETPFYTEYKINRLDDELLQQLPVHLVYSTGPEQFLFANTPKKEHTVLMHTIIGAISEHLHMLHT